MWGELNGFSNLAHTAGGRTVPRVLEIDNKYRWEHLNEHLLAGLVTRQIEVVRRRMRDSSECVFYSMYRIVLSILVIRAYKWV